MAGHLIFVSCNTAIVPAMKMVEEMKKEGQVFVATSVPNIYGFLRKMYGSECMIYFDEMPAVAWRTPFALARTLRATRANKIRLWNEFKRFNGYTVVTFAISYSYAECWILSKLSGKNRLRHYQLFNLDSYTKAFSLAAKRREVGLLLLYGVPYECRRCGGDMVPFIDESYFRRERIHRLPWDDNFTEGIDLSRWSVGVPVTGARVVLVTQDVVGQKMICESEYVTAMDALIQSVRTSVGENSICIKPHPLSPETYGEERRISSRIDSGFPFELILDQFTVVIGYSSFCLVQAARAGKSVISLTRYLRPLSEETATKQSEYLVTQGVDSILFPTSLTEIMAIVRTATASRSTQESLRVHHE